jgi:hypothetical protein
MADLRDILSRSLGTGDDFIIDIGEVLNQPYLVPLELQEAADCIPNNGRDSMTQVTLIIGSDPTDIYGNMTGITGNKGFLFPGQRIVDLNGHDYLPLSRGTAANFFLYPNIVSPKCLEVVLMPE